MLPPEQQKPPILASPALPKCTLRLLVACILFALLGPTAAEQPPNAPPIPPESTPAHPTTSPRLHHEVIGAAGRLSATPMVMIHGFGENTYAWRHLASPLARDRQ